MDHITRVLNELRDVRSEMRKSNMGYPVHTQTERSSLRLDQVEEFSKWLEEYGWEHLPLCQYEVLRMSHPIYEGLIIVWKREGYKSKDYATTQGPSTRWCKRWIEYNEKQATRNTRANQDSHP